MNGRLVVLVMFGSAGAIGAIVLLAFLLVGGRDIRCVEGEMQDNAVRPDGTMLPRVETFETIGEAESFICRAIPYPRETGDLALSSVRVARELNLGSTIEGDGGASVELEYTGAGTERLLLQVAFPTTDLPELTPEAEVGAIRGQRAIVEPADSGLSVTWNRDPFSYVALSRFGGAFDRDALFSALDSVR